MQAAGQQERILVSSRLSRRSDCFKGQWTEQLARDTDRAAAELSAKMVDDQLRKWRDGAITLRGGSPKGQKGWVNRPV